MSNVLCCSKIFGYASKTVLKQLQKAHNLLPE